MGSNTVTTTEVFSTVTIEGVHCWKTCDLEEVDYLKYPHRHLFVIKAYATVNHDDRDIEFIQLKHRIWEYLRFNYFDVKFNVCNFGSKSCEMIGIELLHNVNLNLNRVEVSEDGENGAIVYGQ